MRKSVFAWVASCAFSVIQVVHADAMKWHPGHYVMLATGSQSQHFAQIDEIGKDSAIKGVQVRIWWAELEKSKGVYDFSKIDAYLTHLKSEPVPKRLVVRIMDRKFHTTVRTGIVPSYLLSDPIFNGGLVQSRNGFVARIWERPVMDRLIALDRALGSRYNGNAYFEGIATEETTLSLVSPYPIGYSNLALMQQYVRFVTAVRSAMPATNLFLYTNWIGSNSLMADLIQSLIEPAAAAGGSNIIPDALTQGQKVWTGILGADYRGNLALSNSVEAVDLGGYHGDYTPKQINDFAYNTLGLNYIFWVRNTWSGDASQQWSTGILPFLRTNPPIHTACPSSYGICVK